MRWTLLKSRKCGLPPKTVTPLPRFTSGSLTWRLTPLKL